MVEKVTLARPYAKAAFSAALEANDLASWSSALNTLSQVVSTDTMDALIDSPSLTAEEKTSALVNVCGDELDTKQASFVKVLAENNRLALFSNVASLYEVYRAAHERTVDVTVESAFELTVEQLESLQVNLKKTLERDVTVTSSVDSQLLGGVLIKADDTVIDASVRGRLDKLATAMNA